MAATVAVAVAVAAVGDTVDHTVGSRTPLEVVLDAVAVCNCFAQAQALAIESAVEPDSALDAAIAAVGAFAHTVPTVQLVVAYTTVAREGAVHIVAGEAERVAQAVRNALELEIVAAVEQPAHAVVEVAAAAAAAARLFGEETVGVVVRIAEMCVTQRHYPDQSVAVERAVVAVLAVSPDSLVRRS